MGARQSRRSVDITTTPKKEGLPAEGVVGDAAAPGDGKLEKIEESDAKPTTNGVAPHTDETSEDKDKDKDEATEKEKEKDDAAKVDEPKVESPTTETPAEGAAEVTTPTEGTPASPTTATSPESKETKKKDKPKKKWSFRSISFGKKDKNKPVREDTPKNGDVAKETLAEGGEEAETVATATSPADEKSPTSSPTEKEQMTNGSESGPAEPPATMATEVKAEDDKPSTIPEVVVPAASAAVAAAVAVAASPIDDNKDESSTPAPTNPVPVEAVKVEETAIDVVKIAAIADNTVEVSPLQTVLEAPLDVNSQSKPITNTMNNVNIVDRKIIDDVASKFPSSPPPTPIDPTPVQQAQQVAANASAIAEALKLPAEAANKADVANSSPKSESTIVRSTSPTWPVNEKSEIPAIPTSTIPEQTGNAFPLSPVITNDNNDTKNVRDIAENSNFQSPEFRVEVTETIVPDKVATTSEATIASNVDQSEVIVASNLADDSNQAINDKPEIVEEIIVDNLVMAEKSCDKDLVIQTEEGPVPVSDDIVFEAKPALVVPDSPIEDEVQLIDVSMDEERKLETTEAMDYSITEVVDIVNEPYVNVNDDEDENLDKDLPPPPLPASSVPVPKSTSQLLNFMSTQIEDSPIVADLVKTTSDIEWTVQESSLPISPPQTARIAENYVKIVELESQLHDHEQTDTSLSLPPPEDDSQIEQLVCEPIVEIFDQDYRQSSNDNPRDNDTTINSEISEVTASPAASSPSPRIPTDTTLLTPPRSPSPTAATIIDDQVAATTSIIHTNDDQCNLEFKTESVEDSLNSYDNDSELELRDRLNERNLTEDYGQTVVSCELTNAVPETDQSKVETPVENNVVANDIGTMENNDDAPKSPPPAVPVEAPVPTLGPAITEDVASVTKAIEEIDINEKAVAAAVNENIESANTNEIISEMNHQNNMNE